MTRLRRCFFRCCGFRFPVQLMILEVGWIDTVLIMFVLLFVLAMLRKKWGMAGFLLGCAMSVKQYAIIAAIVSLVWLRREKLSSLSTLFGVALFTTLVVILPFYMVDPGGFLQNVITSLTEQPFRRDSFSLYGILIRHYGLTYSSIVSAVVSLTALFAQIAFLIKRKYVAITDWAGALVLIYSAIFLFGKQAFCNYYQFVSAFLLIFIITDSSKEFNMPRNRRYRVGR